MQLKTEKWYFHTMTLCATYKKKIIMKKYLLIIFIFVTHASTGQTSIYHPFPDTSAVWNIRNEWSCWLPPYPIVRENYSITFSIDTVISGHTYHKLISPYVYTMTTPCRAGVTNLNVYRGAIRQDTSLKKVFIVPAGNNTEELLYDFTLQVGDTVKGYIESITTSNPDIVQSVDSVLVGTSYRKRWLINYSYQIYLIEGIGSTYGLVEKSPGEATDGYPYNISCFQQNGQALYPSTPTSCELITSINKHDKFSSQLDVFPNPSSGRLTISFTNQTIKEIQLIDLLGNIIIKQALKGQTNFEIKDLNGGIYILTLIDTDNKSINRKIISNP